MLGSATPNLRIMMVNIGRKCSSSFILAAGYSRKRTGVWHTHLMCLNVHRAMWTMDGRMKREKITMLKPSIIIGFTRLTCSGMVVLISM
jgi:hypothetical protein